MAQKGLFTDDKFSVGYIRSLREAKWQALRAYAFRLAFWRCQVKGCTQRCEQLHHLHYRTVGRESLEDVLAVCAPHHRMLEQEKARQRNEKGRDTYMVKKYGPDWNERITDNEAWEDFEWWLERKGAQAW